MSKEQEEPEEDEVVEFEAPPDWLDKAFAPISKEQLEAVRKKRLFDANKKKIKKS